ncbi:AraC family transcriptional regulator [Chitinophaga sedimenti]|uniref:helix-turn-helix domain-containing protein n=1 Tax=Chitinophaga sedimenti TaxID=2033606 RepID=UPI002006361C|nr:AraC family transcriptional regulator [Chitinophaga sedimenti]MCK7554897.1 AraC family transcriptional regulator [Chitinophaga sedimenti]
MNYREYRPTAALLPYIECFWTYGAPATSDLESQPVNYCVPLGTTELIIHLEEKPSHILNLHGEGWGKSYNAFFTGLFDYTDLWKASPGSTLFGVRMKPEAVELFFGLPAAKLFNQVTDADAILPVTQKQWLRRFYEHRDAAALIRDMEPFFLGKVADAGNERNYVVEGCRLIRKQEGVSIEDLSAQLYISRRQLERNFKQSIGISPKNYQQIIRFRRLYQYIRSAGGKPIKWAGLSYPLGYSDQAHMVRDCKKFSSLTPLRLAAPDNGVFQSLEASAAAKPALIVR